MKSLLRPYIHLGAALVAIGALAFAVLPPAAGAQTGMSHILHQLNPLISHSSQGYLGVLVSDVDTDSAQKLKLKETRGALITLIDHDAPAGPVLRVNDVVLSVNGENVDGAEQFSRMLKEIPAGRKVTLVISRDGAQQNITVQLVDRKTMEQDVWNKMNSSSFPPPASGMGLITGNGDVSAWHMPLFTSSLNVGALVEPLTSQMAEYLGVPSGVMVKQVARKSEAAAAGLKAFDVILKVGGESITTSADWDRALRSNEGKGVQITILRDRKQQTISLQVDSKRHRSDVEWQDLFPEGECPLMAEVDPEMAQGLLDQLRDGSFQPLTQEQVEQLRQQAEKLRDAFQSGAFPQFQFDQKQMDELKKQMEQFRQGFDAGDFKFDQKQMDELKRQMEEFRKQLPQDFQFDRQQLDKLQREFPPARPGQAA